MKSNKLVILSVFLLLFIYVNSSFDNEFLDKEAIDHDIIEIINKGKHFIAGVNEKFIGMKNSHFLSLLGRISYSNHSSIKEKKFNEEELMNIPSEFDLRSENLDCPIITHVQDQSHCGSCWANAASGVISDRVCIHSKAEGRSPINKLISVNEIMSCTKYLIPFVGGCKGGNEQNAFKYTNINGVVSGGDYEDKETCQPYPFPPVTDVKEYKTPKCKNTCQESSGLIFNEDKVFTHEGYKIPNDELQIRAEIVKNGSVSVGFLVYEDFITYKSGVYKHVTGKKLGGHAVRLIGFGEENNEKYWLAVNSWNTTFGINGTFKIRRGTNECGIEEDVYSVLPDFTRGKLSNKLIS